MIPIPRMQLPEPYVGHESVVIRVDTGRREVRAVVSREALEERFAAGHKPQDWLLAYQTHAEEIQAVVRAKVARASPEGSMSFRVESNTVTGASPARTGWPAGA